MNRCLARLNRDAATLLIDAAVDQPLTSLSEHLPDLSVSATWPAVAEPRIDSATLTGLRGLLLALAASHGFPDQVRATSDFDAAAAAVLREQLPLTAHEAAQDDGWAWLTCCWLLDIAMWRFGPRADRRRYLGDVNRNTFRRLWWRHEILGQTRDVNRLGEDELVAIMERPTIAAHPRFARTIAAEFLDGLGRHPGVSRMHLMRETTKRLLRRTPFVDHSCLTPEDLTLEVKAAVDASAAAILGLPAPAAPAPGPVAAPPASAAVRPVLRQLLTDDDPDSTHAPGFPSSPADPVPLNKWPLAEDGAQVLTRSQAAAVAVDLAARSGQVTNMTLRNLLGLQASEARSILQEQVDAGVLARRGQKRGTHYVLAASASTDAAATGGIASAPRNQDTALRRALDHASGPEDSGTTPTSDPTGTMGRRTTPTVRDLIDTGLIPVGATLTAIVRGHTFRVTVQPDGRVLPPGHDHPRRLGLYTNAITGHSETPMRLWRLMGEDGTTTPLHRLRDALADSPEWARVDQE